MSLSPGRNEWNMVCSFSKAVVTMRKFQWKHAIMSKDYEKGTSSVLFQAFF